MPVNLQLHVLRGDLCNRRSDCYGSVRESPPEIAGKIDRMGTVTVQIDGLRSQGHALSVNGAHATALNNIDHLYRRGLVESTPSLTLWSKHADNFKIHVYS